METKTLQGVHVEIKDASLGTVQAVFCTLDVVDKDDDVITPGAFIDGEQVGISAYGHKSWEGALPVGIGTINVVKNEAILSGQFFMDTTHGKDTFLTVKGMRDLQEWSFGFDVTKESFGEFGGSGGPQVRYIEGIKTFEVSPCLLGSGVNTRTIAAKSIRQPLVDEGLGLSPDKAIEIVKQALPLQTKVNTPVLPHTTPITTDQINVKALPTEGRASELASVYAWRDASGNPENKSSYALPHHVQPNGPASLRALVMGIADLNSAIGAGIPEADRKAAYDHLAAHLRDADVEPPELRTNLKSPQTLKLYDEGAAALSAVSRFIDRATEVMALRVRKSKSLSPGSTDLVSWIESDLARLKALLEAPKPEPAAVEPGLRDEELKTLMAAYAALQG